jgi:hypothetical protein
MTASKGAALRLSAGALLVLSMPAQAAMLKEPVALLQGLDKITARVSKFTAPVDRPVHFGNLTITVRDCEKNPPEERPENAAFLEIDESRPGEDKIRLFSGWMFASSPALSALESPVYDINVLGCEAAGGSAAAPDGIATGKTAR